jgi:hypothetical protein
MEYISPRSELGPCDTFIHDEYRAQAERQAIQKHNKLLDRERQERQYVLANQLSRTTCAEFRDDVLAQMLEVDVS